MSLRLLLIPLLLLAGCAAEPTDDDDAAEVRAVRSTPFARVEQTGSATPQRSPASVTFARDPGTGAISDVAPAAPAARRATWVPNEDGQGGQVRFRRAGFDLVPTRCGVAAVSRYEVDWALPEGEVWTRGGGLEKDPFSVRRDPRLPPKPRPPSPPRIDEHGQPTGSVIPLR